MKRRIFIAWLLIMVLCVRVNAEPIKWVDFGVPYESLKYAMDVDISTSEKEKRISFSDAMTSIEGVPVSERLKNDLTNWKNGNITFLSVFEQTLKRYGFVTEV